MQHTPSNISLDWLLPESALVDPTDGGFYGDLEEQRDVLPSQGGDFKVAEAVELDGEPVGFVLGNNGLLLRRREEHMEMWRRRRSKRRIKEREVGYSREERRKLKYESRRRKRIHQYSVSGFP